MSNNIEDLETQGFTVISTVFSAAELQQLLADYERVKAKALNLITNTKPKPRFFSENDQDNQSVYWKTDKELILQAGKGRYDLYQGFQDGIFATDLVLHNPIFEQLMTQLMVGEYTNYVGFIYSTPGSEDQYWHRDTNNLTNTGTDGAKLVTMDDFCFLIMIPLTVPFTLQNGTTEFMVGSHRVAAKDFPSCKTAQTEVPLGGALVFNSKINHRGKANMSTADRPALYIMYHKKWYNDQYRSGVE